SPSQAPPAFLSIRHCPQRSPVFPYTTLFRSRTVKSLPQVTRNRPSRLNTAWRISAVCPARARASSPVCTSHRRMVRSAPAETRRSEEHTSELQSRSELVCRLLLEKKKHTVGT